MTDDADDRRLLALLAVLLVATIAGRTIVNYLTLPDLSRMPIAPGWVAFVGAASVLRRPASACSSDDLALGSVSPCSGWRAPPWRPPRSRASRTICWPRCPPRVAPLPYATLKLAWGLGWRGGLTDPQLFDGVTVRTPGFGDTAGLAIIGVALAVGMAVPLRHRVVRVGLRTGAVIGAIMLLPVGVLGAAELITVALSPGLAVDDRGLAVWVFVLVYLTFLVWGTSLAATAFLSARAFRTPCRCQARVGVARSAELVNPAVSNFPRTGAAPPHAVALVSEDGTCRW